MTTKYRIVFGFSLLIALMVVLGVIGFRGLQNATGNFDGYDRLAKLDMRLSKLSNTMTDAALNMNQFLMTVQDSDMELAIKDVNALVDNSMEIHKYMVQETRIALTSRLIADFEAYRGHLLKIQRMHKSIHARYAGNFISMTKEVSKTLGKTLINAANAGNNQAVVQINALWDQIARIRVDVAAFINGIRVDKAEEADRGLRDLAPILQNLDRLMVGESGRGDFAALSNVVNGLKAAYESMYQECKVALAEIVALSELTAGIRSALAVLSAEVDDEALRFSLNAAADNSGTQKLTVAVVVIALTLGIIFALFLIITFVGVLNKVAEFARAIADGKFDHDADIREKGEIGKMVEAMRHIPETLQRVIRAGNDFALSIETGHLRTRLDKTAFHGAYADLVQSINYVGASYTNIIDLSSTPIMACDTECKIVFLNKAAQAVVGGEPLNSLCSGQMRSPFCNTAQCPGKSCMSTNRLVTADVEFNPQGKHLDVSVTALPLTDMNGKCIGFLEFVTDLTTIKDAHRTILAVASHIDQVVNRLSAATEQLSAQIEQSGHGTDKQRERVSQSAAAMVEMNATVIEVAKNAGIAAEGSDRARVKATQGADIVQNSVRSINEVQEDTEKLRKNMEDLGHQAESISTIMTVISDIADQTNLLALNAAIEAARAGEAGRGFAVVADEVRKLAEKTMTATKEVGDAIDGVQAGTRQSIAAVAQTMGNLNEATVLVQKSGEALTGIVEEVGATAAQVSSIATAAEEQSAASEEISQSLDEINRMAGENTSAMRQSGEAVSDLAQQAQELRTLVCRLTEMNVKK
jgi:methyl-accepting chemotaxis protein